MDQIFDIDSLAASEDLFIRAKESLQNEIITDFSSRKLNATLILNGEKYSMSRGKVLINLMLLEFFVERGISIEKEDLYFADVFNAETIKDYTNHYLTRFAGTNNNDFDAFRKSVADVLNRLSDISGQLNVLAGNTISLADFVELIATNETARHLFRPEIPYGLQFNEIESLFSELGDKLMKFFTEHKNSELYPYCASGTGINKKQFTQMVGFVGLKPDMHGGVIPVVNTDNFLYGLTSLQNYYINCMGTRKALCTNFTYVRKSGYLTRKLSLAMVDVQVNPDYLDCGTEHFVLYRIENKKKLNSIIGRHYYDVDEGGAKINDELKTITPFDIHLIGKTIGLRSPITCKKENGICATCYGRALAEKNRHINCGLNAVYLITDILTQRLLSAKHLLSTNTSKINFGEDFMDAFTVNLDKIYFNDLTDSIIEFECPTSDDYDESMDAYLIPKIWIVDPDSKRSVEYIPPVDLYLNPKVNLDHDENEKITVSSRSFGDYVFEYVVKNNELTKSLENIISLIESASHLGITDYSEFVNTFDDLLIENGMGGIRSVHAELISSILIRNAETNEPLDFTKSMIDEYKIIRVSKAVMNGPLSKSLAFERLNDQFSDLSTYEKDEKSYFDYLYK